MTSYINFTPLSGAKSEDPVCYLLEIDEARILLDCGWSEEFDPTALAALAAVAGTLDAVLLSHGELEYVGALAYAVRHFGLVCPVYATYPVQNLGLLAVVDRLRAFADGREVRGLGLSDVEAAFDKITTLRYRQTQPLGGKAAGISVAAHLSGHTVGGSIWKISKDTEEIVYAVDYNHKKERHLNSAALMTSDALTRPAVLITSSRNASVAPLITKQRDQQILAQLLGALRAGGSVLIPIEVTTRVLEIALILEQHWAAQRLPYPVVILSPVAGRVLRFAKGMLEYMGDTVASVFSHNRDNPFNLKHVKIARSVEELRAMQRQSGGPGAAVVLASSSTLALGAARTLFCEWCRIPENLVLLLHRGAPASLTRVLHGQWAAAGSENPLTLNTTMTLVTHRKAALAGEELLEYTARAQQQALERQQQLGMEEDADDVDEMAVADDAVDNEPEDESPLALLERLHQRAGHHDADEPDSGFQRQSDVFIKDQSRMTGGFFRGTQSYRMFPLAEYASAALAAAGGSRSFDDFGEAIDPQDYMRGEYHFPEQEGAEGSASNVDGVAVLHRRGTTAVSSTLDSLIERPEQQLHVLLGGDVGGVAAADGADASAAEPGTTPEDDWTAPAKYWTETEDVQVACRVAYVDMEGLADGPSIRNILAQLAPRKVVLVRGTSAETDELRRFIEQQSQFSRDVLAPDVGQRCNVSAAASIWQVRITDACFRQTALQRAAGGYSVSAISGVLRVSEGIVGAVPILEAADAADRRVLPSTIVGSVSISAVKYALAKIPHLRVEYGRMRPQRRRAGALAFLRVALGGTPDVGVVSAASSAKDAATVVVLKCFAEAESEKRLVALVYKTPRVHGARRSGWVVTGAGHRPEVAQIRQALYRLHVIV